MRGLILFAVIAAAASWVWAKRAEKLAQQRELFYQATLRSYSDALRSGLTRKDVESYLRANNKPFRQMCCMGRSGKNAYDDLTKIGKESPPWNCSAHNVYI